MEKNKIIPLEDKPDNNPVVEEYNFTSLLNLIETVENYRYSRKKRKLNYETSTPMAYNYDMECLSKCIEPLRKLYELIGMDSIKKNIIDQVLFYSQGLNTNEMMHTCLTGPPGVGKTTLGKILAEIYCNLGFLSTDKFRVVSRTELIAGYVGQTALKTFKVLNESKGGVLFIDEAYSLGGGSDESGSSYSKECLDTINKFLSENTSDFILIIAGYKEELDRYFFSSNKGLRRRFPWTYDIVNYSIQNLKDIFIHQVDSNNWKFEEVLKLNNYLEISKLLESNKEYFEYNGGDTLLLFDKAKICHSRRVFGKRRRNKKYLNLTDIKLAMELMKSSKVSKDSKSPPFGMYS
jgi:SpoVK/Ycf46/Vps4 family AAA+-type ATPase